MNQASYRTTLQLLKSLLLLSQVNLVDAYYYRRGYYSTGWGWALLGIFLLIFAALIIWVCIYCCVERKADKKKAKAVEVVTYKAPRASNNGELYTTIVTGEAVHHVYNEPPVKQSSHGRVNGTVVENESVKDNYFRYV